MDKINSLIIDHLPRGPMDALAVGVVDFKAKRFQTTEASFYEGELYFHEESFLWFDLASVTKPLTNSLSYFLRPELFTDEMVLCLNHRGGLPSWGRLSKTDWREQILSYPIKESETLYSDFSALRVMLELQKQGIDQHQLVKPIWDQELCFWKDVPEDYEIVLNSMRQVVHDPNALVIDEFCSHAGLFSTINGLCQTLLNYQAKTSFIERMKDHNEHRFYSGWDRVLNPEKTLAGEGCGKHTFGHLGFTGTSVWIDPDKMLGHVILSNATKHHWFDKENLNEFRRSVGRIIWAE
ncbi:MAG TPA: hypothetical protein VKY27_05085 [Bacteriovoracaceae bacterium]|nr:hypothetical protein [Bacteriovoracaceae bacterium]